MNIKFYDYLTEECVDIRTEVFVKEQSFKEEFDKTDHACTHMVVFEDETPIGCGRLYPSKEDSSVYYLGRIAVIKPYRGRQLGAFIMQKLEEEAKKRGAKSALLSAQQQARGFYEKQGFSIVSGEEYFEEHCPHVLMSKEL